jgi:3',5'-cyclic AMP phosphodiesterase CpdA
MRTLVHISDLHFGRIDTATAGPLVRQVQALQPHLVVISGDLTQRARTAQFQEARRFLAMLPHPQIVVPGNHDVPAYNLYKRMANPLENYRRYVTGDLMPGYIDHEIAVFGLNSTRSFTTKHGRLRPGDVAAVCEKMAHLTGRITRVVVCHHPFDLPARHTQRDLIRSAGSAMRAFVDSRVDVILSGHLHLGYTTHTTERYPSPQHSALIVQAGTAISNRRRGEKNSFNVLRIHAGNLMVERFVWDVEVQSYASFSSEEYTRTATGWVPAGAGSGV